tara:strand:- start:116 stop:478 length:363 start_codon:yes stop_codon:yes gene_type:complete
MDSYGYGDNVLGASAQGFMKEGVSIFSKVVLLVMSIFFVLVQLVVLSTLANCSVSADGDDLVCDSSNAFGWSFLPSSVRKRVVVLAKWWSVLVNALVIVMYFGIMFHLIKGGLNLAQSYN